VGQVKQAASGAINKAVKDISQPILDKAKSYAKEAFSSIKDKLGFGGGASTLGGGGGADGAAAHSGAPVEERLPEQSAMNQASNDWQADSTDATPVENTDAVPDLVNGDGVDGSFDVEFNNDAAFGDVPIEF
jgi:hypothetical protein